MNIHPHAQISTGFPYGALNMKYRYKTSISIRLSCVRIIEQKSVENKVKSDWNRSNLSLINLHILFVHLSKLSMNVNQLIQRFPTCP